MTFASDLAGAELDTEVYRFHSPMARLPPRQGVIPTIAAAEHPFPVRSPREQPADREPDGSRHAALVMRRDLG